MAAKRARQVRLRRYVAKRDFSRTPEPRAGERRDPRGAPRFFVQRHAATRLHYDFRLELDGALRSWAVPKGPSLDPAQKRLAVEVEDHPLEYGDFEGVIPAGQYGAGEVVLWDKGTWSTDEDAARALAQGRLAFRLDGQKLHGGWRLVRTGGRDEARRNWLLIKSRDASARAGREADITVAAPQSVKRTAEVATSTRARGSKAAGLPAFVTPQLATLAAAPPAGQEWLYEIKYDGYRVLARIDGRDVRLFTRSGKDWTGKLPHLARAVAKLGLRRAWLDGEIAVHGQHGSASFQALQNAFDAGSDATIVYYVFDLPFADGRDLRAVPLAERKRKLAAAIADKSDLVRFSDHLETEVEDALAHACRLGLEGLIGKRADAAYVGGRTRTWIKLKCRPRQEFVIGGYTDPAGSRSGLGALLVGLHDEAGRLRYAGRVGTGFDDGTLAELSRILHAIRRDAPPFEDASRLPRAALRGVHWVRPTLVAEIAYAGWTDDRVLRQASFVALRADKPAGAVREERAVRIASPPPAGANRSAKVAGVAISHPDRVIWREEGITKAELARYYETVAPHLLPHLRSRPLSLLRCPDGTAAHCFFQKHMGEDRPQGVKTFVWKRSSKDKDNRYLYVDALEGVIGLVQRGSIELHTWGATVPGVAKPDRITIDLDPDPALPWADMADAARLVRALLDELTLRSFLKTTGGKGLHIVVPLARRHPWDEVRAFARTVAEHLAGTFPDRFTAKVARERRKGKILIDYLRNGEGATAVAAFSVRARPGAPVSVPVAWEELAEDLRGARFNLRNVAERIAQQRADPWRDYWRTAQRITRPMRRALGVAEDRRRPRA